MAQDTPVELFLRTLTHLVVTAERIPDPQSTDEFYTRMQAQQDAGNLMDHVERVMMFLRQRLGKLPPLPDITTLIAKKYVGNDKEEETE
jgi:hypothetical protein